MTKRMLIDATHAEETRVVVLDGNRLEDFDVETSTKKQLKGNIYLAKVVRVEPSLQAAFVEYGGNRHGFLAFSEIHPDYYQIPVADRQRLIDMQAEEARAEEEEEDRAAAAEEARSGGNAKRSAAAQPEAIPAPEEIEPHAEAHDTHSDAELEATAESKLDAGPERGDELEAGDETDRDSPFTQSAAIEHETVSGPLIEDGTDPKAAETPAMDAEFAPAEPAMAAAEAESVSFETESPATAIAETNEEAADRAADTGRAGSHNEPANEQLPPPETVGGDGSEDSRDRRGPPRFMRNYKIQEVIKRRQILLVQVVKEERGTKGAALTTYMSLAGRYCVLMPNSPRGGGISRKITSAADRRRLKEITSELDIPRGMGLIVRTAGANRPKPEIKRDCEYLMRLWDDIREHTMRSVAPAQIYEEASLIKRSIRDVYSRDVDEIVVNGEEGWKAARDFMRMLMPSHAKKVQLWRDPQPLFARHAVDAQLDAMMSPTVQLRSGGYLVINQAEALVAIDVNSGRSTRERGIEETALRTNLEAADEVARQLRLRDLAGLIVIDFIDMESRKHNAMVERRLKEALKNDRARIQVGQISHFGLLEMSRQRLRPSLAETNFIPCPHCNGSGHVRGTESSAIHVLRQIEEEGGKRRSAEIVVYAASAVALYILNHKRERLAEIEALHGLRCTFATDDKLIPPEIRIDRVKAAIPSELPPAITPEPLAPSLAMIEDEAIVEEDDVVEEAPAPEISRKAEEPVARVEGERAADGEGEEEAERGRRRRRRRRRGGRREDGSAAGEGTDDAADDTTELAASEADGTQPPTPQPEVPLTDPMLAEASDPSWPVEGVPERADDGAVAPASEDETRARGRGRRGGRRRRREDTNTILPLAEPGAEQPDVPAYTGPTPANPFGGQTFDIFDLMDPEAAHPLHPTGGAGSDQPAPMDTEPFLSAPPTPAEPEPAPAMPLAAEPAETVRAEPIPAEPVAAESIMIEPAVIEPSVAAPAYPVAEEPVIAASEPAQPEPQPEPEPLPEPVAAAEVEPEPANDVAGEPAVKPIMIGAEAEPAGEKKRGWWRR